MRRAGPLLAFTAATACSDHHVTPPSPSTPAATVATIDVTPTTVTLETGDTTRIRAEVRASNGQLLPNASAEWTSSALTVASVSSSGLVTGITPDGTAAIMAS